MNDLNRWLQRQADRDARRPSLEEALLSSGFWRYALHRLRYFLLRYCATAVVHAWIVLLLYHTFGHSFSWILIAYVGVNLAQSFWWGALEAMRGRIRSLHRAGKPHLVPGEIAYWLTLSAQLAFAVAAAIAGWLVWQWLAGGGIDPARGYVMVLLLGLAIDLVTRCYHSGVYALRRIYRPAGAIVAVEAVSLAGILGLRPLIGNWGFTVAALASMLTVHGVSVYYTRRSYRLLRLAPEKKLSLRRLRPPNRAATGELLGGGLSFAVMSLDSLLVLILFGTSSGQHQAPLFLLFFIASPTIRAGADWARLLYFDFKRLELGVFANIRRRFQRAAVRLALVLAVVFWAAASATGTAVLGHSLGALYWPLLAFFIGRSLLALAQMAVFANRGYTILLLTGLTCLAGLLATGLLVRSPEAALSGIAALTLLATAPLGLAAGGVRWARRYREPLGLSEWLARVRAVAEPTRICTVTLWAEPLHGWTGTFPEWQQRQHWRRRELSERIARSLRSGGVAVTSEGTITWFERSRRMKIGNEWLLRRSAGFAQSIRDAGVHPDGAAALISACQAGLLGLDFRKAASVSTALDLAEVKRAFAELAPNGAVYAPDGPVPGWLDQLASKDKANILAAAASFARSFQPAAQRFRFDVTALCDQGGLRQIFVADSQADTRQWHALIKHVNIGIAVGSITLTGTSNPERSGGSGGRDGIWKAEQLQTQPVASAQPAPVPAG